MENIDRFEKPEVIKKNQSRKEKTIEMLDHLLQIEQTCSVFQAEKRKLGNVELSKFQHPYVYNNKNSVTLCICQRKAKMEVGLEPWDYHWANDLGRKVKTAE